jgi:hypothetical protein
MARFALILVATFACSGCNSSGLSGENELDDLASTAPRDLSSGPDDSACTFSSGFQAWCFDYCVDPRCDALGLPWVGEPCNAPGVTFTYATAEFECTANGLICLGGECSLDGGN